MGSGLTLGLGSRLRVVRDADEIVEALPLRWAAARLVRVRVRVRVRRFRVRVRRVRARARG